ncbi:MAG: hypothetical protein WBA51_04155 [Erythrobacter sp.]
MSEASFASLGPTLLARKGGAKPAMRPQLAPLPENSAEIAALADEQLEDLGWNDMGSEEADTENDWDAFANSESDLAAPTPEQDLIVSKAPKKALPEAKQTHEIIDPLSGADIVSLADHMGADHKNKPSAANEDTLDAGSPLVTRQQKQLAQDILAGAAEPTQLLRKKASEPKTAGETAGRAPNKSGSKRRAAFTLRLDTERHLKLRLAATMQGVSAQSIVTEALDAMLQEIEDLDALVDRMKRD